MNDAALLEIPPTDVAVVVGAAALAVENEDRPTNALRPITHGKRHEAALFTADMLEPFGHNRRDWSDPVNLAVIRDFADQIDLTSTDPMDHIREPLVVLPTTTTGKLKILAGETRWRAVLLVEGQVFAPGVPAEPAKVSAGSIRIQCVRGNPNKTMAERMAETVYGVGRKLSDLELAEVFYEMNLPKEHTEEYPEGPLGQGMSQSQIAEAIHKPGQQTHVSQILALKRADPRVIEAVREGRLASTTVVNAYRDAKGRDEEATTMLMKLVEGARATDAAREKAGQSAPKAGRGRRAAAPAKVTKVTAREVGKEQGTSVTATRDPRAHTKVNYETLLAAIQHEASYSPSAQTRENMNDTLKRCGYHPEPCLVDDSGEVLPNVDEIKEKHQRALKRKAG